MKIEITKDESLALKAICALGVFFCHCSPIVNNWGFLFVGVFFFLSGYAMEKQQLQNQALYRVLRLGFLYLLPCLVLSVFLQQIFLKMPIYWYCVEWAVFMLLYRFLAGQKIFLFMAGALFLFFVWLVGFNFVWYASGWLFFVGIFLGRKQK